MEEAVTRMEALVDTAEDAAETAGMAVTVAEEMVEQAAASQSPPETEPPHRWDPAAVRPPWRPTVAEQILEQRASPEGALSPSTTPPPPPPAPAAPLAFPSPPPQTSVGMCGFLSAHAASSGAAPSASDRSPQRRSRDFPTPPPRAAPPPPAAAPVAVAPPSASIPPPPRLPRQPRRREAHPAPKEFDKMHACTLNLQRRNHDRRRLAMILRRTHAAYDRCVVLFQELGKALGEGAPERAPARAASLLRFPISLL